MVATVGAEDSELSEFVESVTTYSLEWIGGSPGFEVKGRRDKRFMPSPNSCTRFGLVSARNERCGNSRDEISMWDFPNLPTHFSWVCWERVRQ